MVLNPFSAFGNDAPPQQGDDAVVRPPPGALHVGEPADALDRLPSAAQDALTELRERVDDLRVAVDHLRNKRDDAWKARSEAETNYRTLTDVRTASRYGRTGIVAEDDPLAVAAKARLDRAARVARETADRASAVGDRWQKQRRLLDAVEAYIASARQPLEMAPPVKVRMPRVDRLESEVARARRDIAELTAEAHSVRSAAFPSSEIRKRVRQEIETLAERGRPKITQMVDHGPEAGIVWPDLVAKSHIFGMSTPLPGDAVHTAHDRPGAHLALIAWMFKDALIEAIEKELGAAAEDEAALSTEARAASLAEIDARILEAERVECALIRASGASVDFREDADPRAILGVDGPPAAQED